MRSMRSRMRPPPPLGAHLEGGGGHQPDRFAHVRRLDHIGEPHAGQRLRQPDQALELARGGRHGLVADPGLPHLHVPADQQPFRDVGPGGSACRYWNGCGSSVTTRLKDAPFATSVSFGWQHLRA